MEKGDEARQPTATGPRQVRKRPAAAARTELEPARLVRQAPAKRPRGATAPAVPESAAATEAAVETQAADVYFHSDLVEVFSPPRVVPEARRQGLRATYSFDLETGTDLLTKAGQDAVWQAIHRTTPKAIVLSPPCTTFSVMQNMNQGKGDPARKEEKYQAGFELLRFAVQVAQHQVRVGGRFILEHPVSASSWRTELIQDLQACPGVQKLSFDQCRYGLTSPGGSGCKKRTSLVHNWGVASEFTGKNCCCKAPHHPIMGSERGVQCSRDTQVYPPALVTALVKALQ